MMPRCLSRKELTGLSLPDVCKHAIKTSAFSYGMTFNAKTTVGVDKQLFKNSKSKFLKFLNIKQVQLTYFLVAGTLAV